MTLSSSVWNIQRSSMIGKTPISTIQMDFTLNINLQQELINKLKSIDNYIVTYDNIENKLFIKEKISMMSTNSNQVLQNTLVNIQQIVDDVEWKQIEINNDIFNLKWYEI